MGGKFVGIDLDPTSNYWHRERLNYSGKCNTMGSKTTTSTQGNQNSKSISQYNAYNTFENSTTRPDSSPKVAAAF
jgi:hypothetical protein